MSDSGSICPGFEAVRIEICLPVAWLVLDNAECGNPVDRRFVGEMRDAWMVLANLSGLGAVGVRSKGHSFSVGVQSGRDGPLEPIGPKSCGMWLPVLIELQGDISAGAFELLGQADMIVSAPDVLFTVPADPAGRLDVQFLRPKLPEPELRRLALLGAADPMTAVRANQLGLVDEVVSYEHLREHSTNALSKLADGIIGQDRT